MRNEEMRKERLEYLEAEMDRMERELGDLNWGDNWEYDCLMEEYDEIMLDPDYDFSKVC